MMRSLVFPRRVFHRPRRLFSVRSAQNPLLRPIYSETSSPAIPKTNSEASSPADHEVVLSKSSPPLADARRKPCYQGCYLPFGVDFKRCFSTTPSSHLPHIVDPDIEAAFKDLMAVSWDEIPDSVVNETKKALSRTTDDVSGKEVLANVFRAAEASVEFGSILVSLRMALDDLGGLSGENVRHLPDGLEDAMVAAYKRYMTYLDSFGPDEVYLRKKVETELGTKMIHIKMRCSGIGSEWGKVSLLGTSGISGSYVEYRA